MAVNPGEIGALRVALRKEASRPEDISFATEDDLQVAFTTEKDYFFPLNEDTVRLCPQSPFLGESDYPFQEIRQAIIQMVWRMVRRRFQEEDRLESTKLLRHAKITVLPPPSLPTNDYKELVDGEYDPSNVEHDPRLHDWLEKYRAVGESLGLNQDPRFHRIFKHLVDPRCVRLLWPSGVEVTCFELHLCQDMIDKKMQESGVDLDTALMSGYGLSQAEIEQLHVLGRKYALGLIDLEPEEIIAVGIQHCEHAIREAKNSGNSGEMLNAMKLWLKFHTSTGKFNNSMDDGDIRAALDRAANSREALPRPK